MAEDEAYRHRLLRQQEQEDEVGKDAGEDEDLQMITSPFLHYHEGNVNANGEHPQYRWSRTRSGWRGRTSLTRLFGPVRSIFGQLTARAGLFLGLLTLLLVFAFWTIKTPSLPPVTDNATGNDMFKVSFARFKAKLEWYQCIFS